MSRVPSTKAWIIVNIFFPLVPFLLEGVIKLVCVGFDLNKLSLTTFSAATLAMSVGLLSVLVNQSLHTTPRSVLNDQEREDMNGTATLFLFYAICAFAFFGILIVLSTLIDMNKTPELHRAIRSFKKTTFALSLFPVLYAILTQQTYKLRTTWL